MCSEAVSTEPNRSAWADGIKQYYAVLCCIALRHSNIYSVLENYEIGQPVIGKLVSQV